MPRVKRGTTGIKKRKRILKRAKGFRFGRSTKKRQAKEALLHAGISAFAHRKTKKRDTRKLWNIKIGASSKKLGISYSQLIGKLTKKNILINRKMLASLAEKKPDVFKKIVEEVK